jgi:hypothetical protein
MLVRPYPAPVFCRPAVASARDEEAARLGERRGAGWFRREPIADR